MNIAMFRKGLVPSSLGLCYGYSECKGSNLPQRR